MTNKNKATNKSLLKILLWPFKSYLRILAVVFVIGLYQYQSIQIDILARKIRNLELQRNQLVNKKSALQVEIDQLTNINRIEKIAAEKFKLHAAGKDLKHLIIPGYNKIDKEKKEEIKLAGVK
jgi:cell division protein FtsL